MAAPGAGNGENWMAGSFKFYITGNGETLSLLDRRLRS